MRVYAAYYDNNIRLESSSGGLFSCIASQFDVIYGVSMTEDCYECSFIRIEDDFSPLRGSKYFQAKIGDTFKQIKKDLMDGKNVLFSGTGCQINGLSSFLGTDFPNLFLLDIICHGVPSPKLWREYVYYQEKKYGKLRSVNFRCKDNSWNDFGMKENQLYISKDNDSFMRMFLRNYCLRPSCYECYAKQFKKSDMTIADFWGIEQILPEMNDGKGISLIITRTDKGQYLFDSINKNLKWKEVSYEEGVRCNPSEYKSVERPIIRDTFYKDLNTISFEKMTKKYAADIKIPLIRKVKNKIHSLKCCVWGDDGERVKQNSIADYGMLFFFRN